MKVLFVSSDLSYGGAEKMLCFVAESLVERGHSVAIANFLEVQFPEREVSKEIEIYRIQNSGKRKIDKLQKMMGLLRCVRGYKPDIIIAFKTTQNWISTIVAKCLRIPIIISERADPYIENLKRPRTRVYYEIINCADGAVFQTGGAKEYYRKKLQEKAAIIPNPVFPVSITANQEENKAIISFGRLDNQQKRYDIMLKAFSIFHRKHSDYQLHIYGTGDDKSRIQAWIEELHLEEAVSFMGYSANPIQTMRNGNIFLITSDYEGISNALLEAMAGGFPVISTDSSPGGARMLINDHENGILVPIQDVQQIAKSLCEIAEDRLLRDKCASNAKSVVVRFAPNKIADMWEAYICKIATMKCSKTHRS